MCLYSTEFGVISVCGWPVCEVSYVNVSYTCLSHVEPLGTIKVSVYIFNLNIIQCFRNNVIGRFKSFCTLSPSIGGIASSSLYAHFQLAHKKTLVKAPEIQKRKNLSI